MAADTDNASQHVAQLLEKLASLDNKVQLYRQDMAQEFQQYSRELLRDVPKDVAARVEQTVADSLHNYPVLNPGFTDLACSIQSEQIVDPIERIELDRRARAGSRSPPPKLPHTSGVPREQYGGDNSSSGPRSPHEREREFHDASALSSSSLNTVATLRPDPTRRHTEETLSSVTSDDSNSRSRPRSALRRSSSSSTKTQSPRRVRFEVEGTEVLPTMSPMLSPRLSDLLSSPLNNDDSALGPVEEATSLQGSLRSDYNDDTPVTELLGSSPPGPKKVSSTDRLKALARSSKEDTSKWTVVGDLQGSDESEDELVMGGRSRQRGAPGRAVTPAQPAQSTATQPPVTHRTNDPRLPSQSSSNLPVVQERDETADADEEESDSDDSDESDESDELMMPTRKPTKGLQPRASTGTSVPLAQSASTAASIGTTETSRSSDAPSISSTATSTSEDTSEPDEEEEVEDMFGFDDENQPASASVNQTTPKKYIEEEDEDEGSELDSPVVTPMRKAAVPSSLPRSVNTAKVAPPPKSPTSAISSAMMGTSMGSYKGRPIILGSVKNEQLHEQASRMGNFTSFVGSVDGRTGVDEKGSYRPEGMAFAGRPKSLSERMLREELEEEESGRRSGATPT